MISLQNLLQNIDTQSIVGNTDSLISGIEFDTRKIAADYIFVAIRGTQTDGHQYIDTAIEKGAKVIVCEEMPANINQTVTYIQVSQTEKALGFLARNFYGNPSSKLKLVGVTGTNGKTTTATLLYRVFLRLGYKVGLFSTVRNYINNNVLETTHTTSDQIQLNRLLAQMVDEGCQYCFMEVSSHSVVQQRIAGLTFAGGIFSNLTHDHLDYHKTFDNYLKAKKTFFDELLKNAFALSNNDDRNGMVMLQNTKALQKTYSLKSFSDFKCRVLENDFDGMLLNIDNHEVAVQFIGKFNAYNLLAVYATAVLLGEKPEQVLTVLSELRPVDGRFETIRSKNGVTAIVDYAHTPDALENVLTTIDQIRKGNELIITVVGAGGNRDKTKRPVMAKIVSEMSDKIILTSDNPRNEKPEDILADMEKGVPQHAKYKVVTITDRKQAIATAALMAKKGDIVLIAGKGHENYQEINGVKHHFDDKEIIKEIFA